MAAADHHHWGDRDRGITAELERQEPEQEWLALGPARHMLALAMLSLVALALYHPVLLRPREHADETIYVAAAALIAAGESPFQVPGYYYPAAFAYAWAATEEIAFILPAWLIWRVANLAAAVALVWLAAIHLPGAGRRWWLRPLLGAPLLAAPGISLALRTGNVSVLTATMVAAGVLAAGRRWMAGGLLLGSSVALKPFALPALVALLAPWLAGRGRAGARLASERRAGEHSAGKHSAGEHPAGKHSADKHSADKQPAGEHSAGQQPACEHPAGEWSADRWLGPEQRAGLLGIVLAGAVLLGPPYARELLTQPIETLSTIRTVSFDRLFRLLGLPLPRVVVIGVVYAMLAGAATLWTRIRIERQLVAFAGAMVAAPLVWSHTMILGLPMLTLALACHAPDLASRAPADRRPRLVALAVVALVALQLFFQPGGFDHHPVPIQILFAVPMLAAPPLTAALVIRRLRAGAVLPGG